MERSPDGRPPSLRAYAHEDTAPVAVTMTSRNATIKFTGGHTARSVRRIYAALASLIPSHYTQLAISDDGLSITLNWMARRHPIREVDSSTTA